MIFYWLANVPPVVVIGWALRACRRDYLTRRRARPAATWWEVSQ